MRFSCMVGIVVLCLGVSSAQQRTLLAQPYQKAWTGPHQRGPGAYQKHHAYATHPYLPSGTCQQPCCSPCEPVEPKGGEPKGADQGQPRAAAGIAPGVFVSPPQSGEIEGPSRGFEIGDISLTLPEIKLGLPRLRCTGIKHFSREPRMMTDRAAAPYVANPYYAAAVAQQQAVSRAAESSPDDGMEKGAEKEDGIEKDAKQADVCAGMCQSDLECRVRHLEDCLQTQMQVLQGCIEELKALQSAGSAYQKSSNCVPPPTATDAEARSDVHIRSPRSLPVVFDEEAARTSYEVHVPANTAPLSNQPRRLPVATQ